MTFQDSVRTCFTKSVDFEGEATRSEYWWFVFFIVVGGFALAIVSRFVSGIFSLVTLIPAISAATRRLHDTNRSGWWQLLVLVFFLVQEGDLRPAG